MKKTRFGIIVGTVSLMVTSTFACIVLSNKKDFKLTGFADAPYTCDLPTVDYVEIQTIIDEIYSSETTNNHIVRGTITKRLGDVAYLQRKNQATQYIDAIRLKGLDSYGDDIAVGNVIDITGGDIYLENGIPTLELTNESFYTIPFNTNPYGWAPLQYDGCAEYMNYGCIDTYNGNQTYAYSRYIQLNRVKLWDPTPSDEYTFTEGTFPYSSVYDFDNMLHEIMFIVATDDDAVKEAIYAKTDYALTNNKLVNIRGNASYQYGYHIVYLNSADDIDVLSDGYYDSNVVSGFHVTNFRYGYGNSYLQGISLNLVGHDDVPYMDAMGGFNVIMRLFTTTPDYLNRVEIDPYNANVVRYWRNYEGYLEVNASLDTITVHKNTSTFGEVFPRRTDNDVRYQATGLEPSHCEIDEPSSVSHNSYAGGKTYLEEKVYDFGSFDLDIVKDDNGIFYVPMTLLADIVSGYPGYSWAYNGADMFLISAFLDEHENFDADFFYEDSPWDNLATRSQAMADYTYNAFCFSLKYFYGLSDIRILSNPDALIDSLGYKTDLLSTDTLTFETAFAQFVGDWFYEGHSGYISPSPYVKDQAADVKNVYFNERVNNARNIQIFDNSETLHTLRYNAYVERNDGREEVGLRFYQDIAVITFDHFKKYYVTNNGINITDATTVNLDDYTYTDLQEMGSDLLFRKAFNEIDNYNLTAGTPVSNVVIDLSLNTGGMVDSLPFLSAYLTEDPSLCINYRTTGECDEIYYNVDIDYDGHFNGPNDTYQGKFNFFCLTSPVSFSCGNNFPTYLQTKGLATIIGQQSGGGLCIVGRMATASGTVLRNSSNMQLGAWDDINGEFVGSEYGITPDASLAYSNFYNDVELYNLIHSI